MLDTDKQNKYDINSRYFLNKTNPIVKGYFPTYKTYKEMAVSKVNKILCVLLFISIFVTLVSYYFVMSNEIVLNDIRKDITLLNEENFDLQNKLDNLKSYYNVDKTMRQKNLVNKPQQVLEVNQTGNVDLSEIEKSSPIYDNNFNWALGF